MTSAETYRACSQIERLAATWHAIKLLGETFDDSSTTEIRLRICLFDDQDWVEVRRLARKLKGLGVGS